MELDLQGAIAELIDVAERLGKHVLEVHRDEWRAHKTVPVDERRFGGFRRLKQLAAMSCGESPDPYVAPERQYAVDQLAYTRKIEKQLSRNQYQTKLFEDRLCYLLQDSGPIVARFDPPKSQYAPGKRTLVGVISDTHYGLQVDGREVPSNEFGWLQAARRTALLVEQLRSWKPERRDDTDLCLVMAGDVLEGIIHADTQLAVEAMAFQVWGAAQILVRAIDELRRSFGGIRILCTPGNHDRATHRGKGRSTQAKWDSYATTLYQILVAAFRNADDVRISIPRTPYVTDTIQGHLVYASHGDTVTTTGNIGRSINVEKIVRQIHSLNSSGILGRPVDVVLVGHVHVPCYTVLGNGACLVVNGTLSGNTPFAQSIGIHASHPSQVIFEMTPEHAVGDFRVVRLRDADDDAALDDVIPCPTQALDRLTA